MQEYIIHLLPRSGLEGNLTSSTIFGALCWAIRSLYGERQLVELLAEFANHPPFLVSSLFPWKQVGDSRRYYLPKPAYPPLSHTDLQTIASARGSTFKYPSLPYHAASWPVAEMVAQYKEFQKITWIPEDIFRELAAGKGGETSLFEVFLTGCLPPLSWKTDLGVQKNTLDRLLSSTGGAGNTFYNRERYLRRGFGLYFLLKTDRTEVLVPALRFIADHGLGTNARTGKNYFLLSWEPCSFTPPVNGGITFVALSRYLPHAPIERDKSWYDLEVFRAKVESREEFSGVDIWKDAVMYLKEGAIITLKQPVEHPGQLLPVKHIKGKTIWQYGFAYPYWGAFVPEVAT